MNKKTKIITFASICSALVVALVVTLCCVFLIKHDPYKIEGDGAVIVTQNEDGTKTLSAKASKWHSFMGWYENVDDKEPTYTTEEITIGDGEPVYTAVFTTSPLNSIDRLLSGIYYKYSEAIAEEEDYFNFSGNIELNLKTASENFEELHYTIEAGGYFNFNGEGNQLYLLVKPTGTELNMISFYYVDNTMDGKIYAQVMGEKYTFNCASLTEVFSSIPALSQNVWTFENIMKGLINNDSTFNMIYPLIEQMFGGANTVAFWSEANNDSNISTFSLRLDKILKYLDDNFAMIKAVLPESVSSVFEKVLEVLTKEYINQLLPSIDLNFKISYTTLNDIEYINDIDVGLSLPNGYNINFGEVVNIPSTDLSLKINNLEMGFSSEANAVNEEILKDFPEATNILNMELTGEINFIKQEGETKTTLDTYTLELNADLNPFAVLPGIVDGGFDATKVKWEELGFLSLRISLVENPEDETQMERHGNVKDYINLLIDTEKYGAKAMLFVGLYNPNITAKVEIFPGYSLEAQLSKNEIINASIDLKEFVTYLTNKNTQEGGEEVTTSQTMSVNMISNVVEDVATDNVHVESIIFDILSSLLGSSSDMPISNSDLTYDAQNETIVLALSNVRTKLKEIVNTDLLDLGNVLFGTENTHLSIGLKTFEYGKVVRGESEDQSLADYVDKDGNSIFEEYNEQHKTLLSVEDLFIKEADGLNDNKVLLTSKQYSKDNFVEEIESSLMDKTIYATTGTMSDNSKVTTFPNSYKNAEEEAEISFRLLGINVVSQNENSAQIEYVLGLNIQNYWISLASSMNLLPEEMKGCVGIYDILFKLANIPFVYTVTETVQLV